MNHRLYTWGHWNAAELIFDGCGDDHFTDFHSWVIAQGREVFEAFLADPDSIASLPRIDDDEVGDAELFSYAASEVYEEATGDEIDVALPDVEIVEPVDAPAGEAPRRGRPGGIPAAIPSALRRLRRGPVEGPTLTRARPPRVLRWP